MQQTRHLYVLDSHPETAQVLAAILGPAGAEVTSLKSSDQIQASAGTDSAVYVLNARLVPAEKQTASRRVMIGRNGDVSSTSESSCQQLDEIFEYPDLVRAIESLWNRAG